MIIGVIIVNIKLDSLELVRYNDKYCGLKDEFENGKSHSNYIHYIGDRLEKSKDNMDSLFESAFVVLDENEDIGYLYISNVRNDEVFLEYAILDEFRGMGYASSLIREISDYLFEEYNIRSIRLDIDPSNKNSMNVACACDFIEDEEEYASRNFVGRIQFVKDSYCYSSKRRK